MQDFIKNLFWCQHTTYFKSNRAKTRAKMCPKYIETRYRINHPIQIDVKMKISTYFNLPFLYWGGGGVLGQGWGGMGWGFGWGFGGCTFEPRTTVYTSHKTDLNSFNI